MKEDKKGVINTFFTKKNYFCLIPYYNIYKKCVSLPIEIISLNSDNQIITKYLVRTLLAYWLYVPCVLSVRSLRTGST